jgi:hypothetical protein
MNTPAGQDQGFLAAFGQLISASALEALGGLRSERRGCKSTLPLAGLLQGLLFHFLFSTDSLAEHLRQLTGQRCAESTLAGRRTASSRAGGAVRRSRHCPPPSAPPLQ